MEDLAEGKISPAEEKFERLRKTSGLFIGPLVFIIFYFIPTPNLTPKAHILSAVLLWIITWWISEPIPIPATSFLAVILCTIFGVADVKQVLSAFSDPLIYLFLGSFILARAMVIHGLDKRFSYKIMSLKWVEKSTGRLLFAYGGIAAFLSMWVSNTATTAMMFPIGLGIISATAEAISKSSGKPVNLKTMRFGTGMMLMAAYASSAGGIGTPVGTPPNLIGIGLIEKFTHVKISFVQWMSFAVPLLIVMYSVLFVLLYILHKPEVKTLGITNNFIHSELSKLGKLNRGEINSMVAFGVTVILWLIPGVLALIFGSNSSQLKAYNLVFPESIAVLIGCLLLFLLPVNWKERKFTLSWNEAVKIDWGTLLIFGSGLTLGNLMYETKLADFIGNSLMYFGGANSVWVLTFLAIIAAVLISEATSNTASANMIVPVVISICIAGGINPLPPAIGATIGASWGFMLPVSTPPNAIVYGSGMVPITKMLRTGIFFDIIGVVLIWLGLRIMLPLVGLA